MIRTTLIAIAATIAFGAFAASAHAADSTCTRRGHAMLTALQGGHYDDATKHFDATMQAQLTPTMLGSLWKSMAQKFGTAHPATTASVAHQEPYTVVSIPLGFKDQSLAAEVACDASGAIAGFHVAPQANP